MTELTRYMLHRDELVDGVDGLAQFIQSLDGSCKYQELADTITDSWLPQVLERGYESGYENGTQDAYNAGYEDGAFEAGQNE